MKLNTILFCVALAHSGCNDSTCWEDGREVKPRLGLALPDGVEDQTHQAGEKGENGCREEPTCAGVKGLCTGDAFVVIHEIAQEVGETPYPLKLTITTACAEQQLEARHFEGVVVRPVIAPECAEQGVVVTAEIANSRTSCPVAPLIAGTCATEESSSG